MVEGVEMSSVPASMGVGQSINCVAQRINSLLLVPLLQGLLEDYRSWSLPWRSPLSHFPKNLARSCPALTFTIFTFSLLQTSSSIFPSSPVAFVQLSDITHSLKDGGVEGYRQSKFCSVFPCGQGEKLVARSNRAIATSEKPPTYTYGNHKEPQLPTPETFPLAKSYTVCHHSTRSRSLSIGTEDGRLMDLCAPWNHTLLRVINSPSLSLTCQ